MAKNVTVPVRDGETLNLEALQIYLSDIGLSFQGGLRQEQYPAGYSNLSYLLKDDSQSWVLRRPPVGASAKGGHDMGREYRILSGLHPVYGKVPRPIHYCDDEAILGAPFYLMEKVEGLIVRKELPSCLASEGALHRFSTQLVDSLADIHSVDLKAAGFEDLGRPEGYVKRQILGWQKRYSHAQTDLIPQMEKIIEWLKVRMPEEASGTLIHNDYKIDNIVLDEESANLVAVLDWEMATVGCPLMDLGASLGYWVDRNDPEPMRLLPVGPTHKDGYLSRKEAVARYEERTGRKVNDPVFYYVYGLWRIAAILQQIYLRYIKGHTRDTRFSQLIHGVRLLALQAEKAIEQDRYWDLS